MMILSHSSWKLIALAAAGLLVGEFSCCWPSTAQTTSTWTAGGTMDNWTDPANWDNDPPMEAYPDNNGGGNFIVEIPGGRVTLDDDITISSLSLGLNTAEGGFVTGGKQLTSEIGTLIGTQGGFDGGGGTFTSEGGIDVAGSFLINNWTVNAQQVLAVGVGGGNGGVNLKGNAQLILQQGLEFLKNGSISSPGGNELITNQGDFKRASSATGQSNVEANFVSTGGSTVGTTSGTLRFAPDHTAMFTNSTFNIDANGMILLSGNTTINGTATVAGNGVGNVKLDGTGAVVTLNGTLQNMFNASDSPSVEFKGNKFSGGTLNLQAGPGFIHSGGNLGVDGIVTNRGRYNWTSGTITGMGLVNENDVEGQTVFSTTADKIIAGTALNNMGHITQTGSIRLDADGKVINSIGATYRLQNAIVNAGQTANTETGFFNQGTLESAGNSLVVAPLSSSKTLSVKNGTLKLARSTLSNTVEIADKANLEIGTSAASQCNLTSLTFKLAGTPPLDSTTVKFVGGLSSLMGTIKSEGNGQVVHTSGTVQVRSGDSATLQFADSAPFVIDSDPNQSRVQIAGSLTNSGAIRWEKGTINGAGQFVNAESNGLITVTGSVNLGNQASSTILNNDGVINVASPVNQGILLPTDSKIINRREGLFDFVGNGIVSYAEFGNAGSFENQGILGKVGGDGDSRITLPYLQTSDGILDVQSGSLRFTDQVTLQGTAENPTTVEVQSANGQVGVQAYFSSDAVAEHVKYSIQLGDVIFQGPTATFRGTHTGAGSRGQLGLFASETQIDGSVVFDVKGTQLRVQQGRGIVQGTGRVTNQGNYNLVTGEIANLGTNPPTENPETRAFNNEGKFRWFEGVIRTSFGNGASGVLEIRSIDEKRLADAALYNSGSILHFAGALEANKNASIVNQPDGMYQIYNEAEINPPESGGAGDFASRGTLQFSSFSNNGPAQIRIPFTSNGGKLMGSVDAKLNISAGYTLKSSTIDLTGRASLEFGTTGTVEGNSGGTTINLASTSNVLFNFPELSGAIRGSGTGKATFAFPKVKRNDSLIISMGNPQFRGDSELFGIVSNIKMLTINPGPANGLSLLEVNESGNPLGSGGILRNVRGANLLLEGVRVAYNLAAPLAESQWGQIQNEGSLSIKPAQGNPSLTLNETLLRNFQSGRALSTVNLIAGNGRIENQGTFRVEATTIDVPFDNTGTFTAVSGNNDIRNLTQFVNGVLTGGTYVVQPGATLNIGSGNMQQNLADITLEGATATFEQLSELSSNAGDLSFLGSAAYHNASSAFANSGQLNLNASSASFHDLDVTNGSLTAVGNSSLSADNISIQSGGFARVDDSTITASQVNNGGTLNIGSSPGYALIDGNYTQTGTLEMEIGGLVPGVDYDLLEITGTAQLGGILDVTGLDLGSYNPTAGDSFSLLTSTNPIQGTFDQVNYPLAVGGWFATWDPVDYSDPNEVVLEIASVDFLQADFDQDSDVDRDDLTKWQNGYGLSDSATHMDGDADGDLDVDGRDFMIWQRQAGVAGATDLATAVPEPACGLLALCASLLSLRRSILRGRSHFAT